MERTKLLNVLKAVEPALSTTNFVPILSCFCFDGKVVTAYDDVVALQHPLQLSFDGAIPGVILLQFLAASKAKMVDLTKDGEDYLVKAGRARLKVGVPVMTDSIFKMPSMKKAMVAKAQGLVEAVEKCNLSLGRDPSHPWRNGATLRFAVKKCTIYATDNITLSTCVVACKYDEGLEGKSVLLPPRFCELLATIGAKDRLKALQVHRDWVVATFESGLLLFSRVAPDADVKNYKTTLKHLQETTGYVEVPKGLQPCVERALVVADKGCTMTVTGGNLKLHTESNHGEVRDSIAFPDHAEIEIVCVPELLNRVLPYGTHIAIKEDCVAVSATGYNHFISLVS